LINNRQQGGRRRGRGGQRGQNLGSGGSGGGGGQLGNRQDNRQRGNAAQLLEKYKSLARDAQLAGDRVQTEYYLQYADHYFRVLGESRSRFEEQRRQRGDGSDDDEGDDDLVEADGETPDSDERPERQERAQRQDRGERYSPREPREPREAREPRQYARDDRGGNDDGDEDMDRPAQRANGDDDSLPLDVLPPAIGADGPSSLAIDELPEPEPAPAPRRTRAPRRPKSDDGVAPAT
jgi:hypothetical protein